MELHPVAVVSAAREADGLVLLRLAAGGWSESLTRPGQYLMFKGPGDEKGRPVAVATPPGHDPLEVLLKVSGAPAERLLGLREGDHVQCSSPAGPGYPVFAVDGPLLLVATGSALAPIRAAVLALLAAGPPPHPLRLVVGVRDGDALPFQHDLRRWQEQGVAIDVVHSRPRAEPGAEPVLKGRVQSVLDAPVFEDHARAQAFVCGQPAMMEEVTALLVALGVPRERIYRNF